NWTNLLEELDGQATKNNIENLIINRGSILLLFDNGEKRLYSKNDLAKLYPWGWVSNHFMYSEDKKPEPKVEATNPLAALMGSKITKTEPTMTKETTDVPKHDPLAPNINPVNEPKPIPVQPMESRPLPDSVGEFIQAPAELKKEHKIREF